MLALLYLTKRQRHEANIRAPDYAQYYLNMYGEDAETVAHDEAAACRPFTYRRHMHEMALREVRRLLKRRRLALTYRRG